MSPLLKRAIYTMRNSDDILWGVVVGILLTILIGSFLL